MCTSAPVLKITSFLHLFQRQPQKTAPTPTNSLGSDVFQPAGSGSSSSLLSRTGSTLEMSWFQLQEQHISRSKGQQPVSCNLAKAWNRINVYPNNKSWSSSITNWGDKWNHISFLTLPVSSCDWLFPPSKRRRRPVDECPRMCQRAKRISNDP